jgi:hypothetical protein
MGKHEKQAWPPPSRQGEGFSSLAAKPRRSSSDGRGCKPPADGCHVSETPTRHNESGAAPRTRELQAAGKAPRLCLDRGKFTADEPDAAVAPTFRSDRCVA